MQHSSAGSACCVITATAGICPLSCRRMRWPMCSPRRAASPALREEGDRICGKHRQAVQVFLSTPSARRATVRSGSLWLSSGISIHTLREEGDSPDISAMVFAGHFYSRPPRGGRLREALFSLSMMDFYPRPPRGGRRDDLYHRIALYDISIHALREEGDSRSTRASRRLTVFLSTPSVRRATSAVPERG